MIDYTEKCRLFLRDKFKSRRPRAFVHTYGCQGNVADSEIIKGILDSVGYVFTDSEDNADLILFNTCAVREHAEDRVFGNIGRLKKLKENNPELIIVLCGCMMQQQSVCDKIKKSYPYVSIVFGTFAIKTFPELLFRYLVNRKRLFDIEEVDRGLYEGMPLYRDNGFKAWLPIMYGCNNFCTYCIVPYVRGRERSRDPDNVVRTARDLISSGAKEITLLGQNVNSYGKGTDTDFADLLRLVNDVPGDFWLRFMTSHPKDCTKRLLDTMAGCEKCARHLHLPFQSGCNRVLKAMNRNYTAEKYLDLIAYARSVMPDISVTSDVIVGFPNETDEEFEETLQLIKTVRFTSLFTFIYSPRIGTPAAEIQDRISYSQKTERMSRLLSVQESIAAQRNASLPGKKMKVLCESVSDGQDGYLMGRTAGNLTIDFPGDKSLIGMFAEVEITQAGNWQLRGRLAE